jgi:hypothetical protein
VCTCCGVTHFAWFLAVSLVVCQPIHVLTLIANFSPLAIINRIYRPPSTSASSTRACMLRPLPLPCPSRAWCWARARRAGCWRARGTGGSSLGCCCGATRRRTCATQPTCWGASWRIRAWPYHQASSATASGCRRGCWG